MKRSALIIILALGVATAGIPIGAVHASRKASCCGPKSACATGLQKMSCCESPANTAANKALFNVEKPAPVSVNPVVETALDLKLACDKNPPKEKGDTPPEESSLYLKYETFLI